MVLVVMMVVIYRVVVVAVDMCCVEFIHNKFAVAAAAAVYLRVGRVR